MNSVKFLCLVFILSLSMGAEAQVFKGKTVDKDGRVLAYVNVCLLQSADSSFVKGTVSDGSGEFVIHAKVKEGIIRASLIGYQTTCEYHREGSVGNILMIEDTNMLGEVFVKGRRPLVQLKNDALVTRVQGSPLAHAGTVKDVLGKIPGVINNKEEIEVLGKGSPSIYINGRLVRNLNELNQLTSDRIKDIEVVTTPGAKYDASVNSVIRINMLKPVGDGFSLDSRTLLGLTHYLYGNEEVNLNYRHDGLDVFGMLGYDYNKYRQQNRSHQYTFASPGTFYQFTDNHRQERTNLYSGKLGLNYIFNKNHAAGIFYDFNFKPVRTKNCSSTSLELDQIVDNELTDEGLDKLHDRKHALSGYYSGKLGKWSMDLNLDALWGKADTRQTVNEVVATGENRDFSTRNDIDNRLYALKAIVSHPVGNGQFSLGTEWSLLHRKDMYSSEVEYIDDSDSKIEESNGAAFVEMSQRIGKASIVAGLRYEHVISDYFEHGVKMQEQSRSYDNLFPSVMVSMPLGQVRTRLSYSRKITRPAFSQLSSNIQYVNRYTYQSGNPYLQPSIRDYVELMTNFKWLTFMVNYAHVKDYMMSVYTQYGDDVEVSLIQKQNVEAYDELTGMINLSPSVGKYHPALMMGVRQQFFSVTYRDSKMKLNNPMGIFRFNNAVNLPFDSWLNADFSWRTGGNAENMHIGNTWQFDLGFYKAFANDKWSVKLQCDDLFDTAKSRMTLKNGIREINLGKILDTRKFSITFTYKLNSARSKYKGTGAGEDAKQRL